MRDIEFLRKEDQYAVQRMAVDCGQLSAFGLDETSQKIVRCSLVLKWHYIKTGSRLNIEPDKVKRIYVNSIKSIAEQLGYATRWVPVFDSPPKPPEPAPIINNKHLNKNLSEIPFNSKSFRLFRFLKIKTVAELLQYNPSELAKVRNIGKRTVRDIRRELSLLDIKFQ